MYVTRYLGRYLSINSEFSVISKLRRLVHTIYGISAYHLRQGIMLFPMLIILTRQEKIFKLFYLSLEN